MDSARIKEAQKLNRIMSGVAQALRELVRLRGGNVANIDRALRGEARASSPPPPEAGVAVEAGPSEVTMSVGLGEAGEGEVSSPLTSLNEDAGKEDEYEDEDPPRKRQRGEE